jgi:HlyD family secretion protein
VVTGRVERISPQATIRNNIKGYPARIVLKNVDPRVRPGMTANVKIPVAAADNVTAVPLSAVFTEKNPDTGEMERFVYVQRGDGFEKRDVKIGVSDYSFAEIQEGLSPGDVVSLEMPKEEVEKKTNQFAGQKPNGEGKAASAKPPAGLARTNTATADTFGAPKNPPGPAPVRATSAGGKS